MDRQTLSDKLKAGGPKSWLVTGAAGFIGSNLLEFLLQAEQEVIGLDNFATGSQRNLDIVQSIVSHDQWACFSFIEGDITSAGDCAKAVKGVDYVLHQAALGSVPRSIKEPAASHRANVDGFFNVLNAAREAAIKRVVYASSSAVYGDSAVLPKVEQQIGSSLSPYATTKYINELYADIFYKTYGIESIGLRYFNVFGPRQDPEGAYAAVIPKWLASLRANKHCQIYGDGETSRDFCYVDNVIQANVLAAISDNPDISANVLNIAYGERTTLVELHQLILDNLKEIEEDFVPLEAEHVDFRAGDVRHSLADISAAKALIGYNPQFSIGQGMKKTLESFVRNLHMG